MGDAFLTPREVAARLGTSTRLLKEHRVHGSGPAFVRVGYRTVRYPEVELERWIDSRTIEATQFSPN